MVPLLQKDVLATSSFRGVCRDQDNETDDANVKTATVWFGARGSCQWYYSASVIEIELVVSPSHRQMAWHLLPLAVYRPYLRIERGSTTNNIHVSLGLYLDEFTISAKGFNWGIFNFSPIVAITGSTLWHSSARFAGSFRTHFDRWVRIVLLNGWAVASDSAANSTMRKGLAKWRHT